MRRVLKGLKGSKIRTLDRNVLSEVTRIFQKLLCVHFSDQKILQTCKPLQSDCVHKG